MQCIVGSSFYSRKKRSFLRIEFQYMVRTSVMFSSISYCSTMDWRSPHPMTSWTRGIQELSEANTGLENLHVRSFICHFHMFTLKCYVQVCMLEFKRLRKKSASGIDSRMSQALYQPYLTNTFRNWWKNLTRATSSVAIATCLASQKNQIR